MQRRAIRALTAEVLWALKVANSLIVLLCNHYLNKWLFCILNDKACHLF